MIKYMDDLNSGTYVVGYHSLDTLPTHRITSHSSSVYIFQSILVEGNISVCTVLIHSHQM